jgi:hypothetical protein
MRTDDFAEKILGKSGHFKETGGFIMAEVGQVGRVPDWRGEKMTVVVWEFVHNKDGGIRFVNEEGGRCVFFVSFRGAAEETAVILTVVEDVFHPPGCPKTLHKAS